MAQPPDSMVLLHGFASTFDHNWRATGWVDILGDFECVVPDIDLPGHGRSVRWDDPQAYATVDEDVASLLPSPTCAVGFSAGAEILLRVAIARPGTFERMALLGVGDSIFETSDSTSVVDALEADAEPDDVQARLFRRLAQSTGNDPRALAAFLRRPRLPLRIEDLSSIDCPVLVVLGARDFVVSADRLVAALPSASLVSVPGVDHFATPSNFGVIDATMRFFGFV
jgi:pimeloyl-ACP methyl ester carboxylesterase